MFTGLLPPIVAQLLLVLVLVAALLFVIRIVARSRKQKTFSGELSTLPETEAAAVAEELPRLLTAQRVTAPIRRILAPTSVTPVPQVEIGFGKRRLIFTPSDFVQPGRPERYKALVQTAPADNGTDLALFALCTLEPGGADSIRSQIKDYDKIKDAATALRLIPVSAQPGDYIVIARILSHRSDQASEDVPVTVYRAEVLKSADQHLVLELAVPDEGQPPFADGDMVHGTARLYGYLP